MSTVEKILVEMKGLSETGSPYFRGRSVPEVPDIVTNIQNYTELIPPVVLASRDSSGIKVFILTITNTLEPLQYSDFRLGYYFTLNDSGKPQLDICVEFDTRIQGSRYSVNSFSIFFDNNEKQNNDFEHIETVRVFLVDMDPETSRGTETTVQQRGG